MDNQKSTAASRQSENGSRIFSAGQKMLTETLPAARDAVDQIHGICAAAVEKSYDQVTATMRTQIAAAFPDLLPRFDQGASFGKDNLDAFFAAGAVLQKCNHDFIGTAFACNERFIEVALENTKSFFGIDSLKEIAEKHSAFARGQFDAACSNAKKMSELGVKVAAAWEPVQTRWGKVTSKAGALAS